MGHSACHVTVDAVVPAEFGGATDDERYEWAEMSHVLSWCMLSYFEVSSENGVSSSFDAACLVSAR